MTRSAIESDFPASKLDDGRHFVKKILINKVAYLSEMARSEIKSDFQASKMAGGGHFVGEKVNQSCVLI